MNSYKVKLALILVALIFYPLLMNAAPAAQAADSNASSNSSYKLTDSLQVEVKSVLNELTADGTRIGIGLALSNQGKKALSLPGYELRVETDEGVSYTLVPSAENPTRLQPKEKKSFSYMVEVNRDDPFTLNTLRWVEVDPYVYPKSEVTKLSLDIADLQWRGSNAPLTQAGSDKQWSDAFVVPSLSPTLQFQMVQLENQTTEQGMAAVLTLSVVNKGDTKQFVPAFLIQGESATAVYVGSRIEQDQRALVPGEQSFLHYSIPVGSEEKLNAVTFLTQESFSKDEKSSVDYTIGRLRVHLPLTASFDAGASSYELGNPIVFDRSAFAKNMTVTLDELKSFDGEDGRFRVLVAKFKLLNTSPNKQNIPDLAASLSTGRGTTYEGMLQDLVVKSLIPNIPYVIYYSFIVPVSEEGSNLYLSLSDTASIAPYSDRLAYFQCSVVKDSAGNGTISMYPNQIKVNGLDRNSSFDSASSLYKNTISLDMTVSMGSSVTDAHFTKLLVEITDKDDRVYASQSYALGGADRLRSGAQTIEFKSKGYLSVQRVKLYEVVDTAYGQAKRLLQAFN